MSAVVKTGRHASVVLSDLDERRLRAVWMDRSIKLDDVAESLGKSTRSVIKLARTLGLPARTVVHFKWTAELEDAVRAVYEREGGPAVMALNIPGMSPAVMSGAATRLGWVSALRGSKPGSAGGRKPAAGPALRPAARVRRDPVKPSKPKIMADHCKGECIFPVGPEPVGGLMSDQLFCCEPVEAGQERHRYCKGHAAYAFLGRTK
jgi:hypothetical protein